MRLTQFSDYALRVLMYAAEHADRLVTITELATFHGISRSHLTKVVFHLASVGFVQSVRGRAGGIRLADPPQQISIGAVLRSTEEDFRLVECFDRTRDTCVLTPNCRLARGLHVALDAFFKTLDGMTLADLTSGRPAGGAMQTMAFPKPKSRTSRAA